MITSTFHHGACDSLFSLKQIFILDLHFPSSVLLPVPHLRTYIMNYLSYWYCIQHGASFWPRSTFYSKRAQKGAYACGINGYSLPYYIEHSFSVRGILPPQEERVGSKGKKTLRYYNDQREKKNLKSFLGGQRWGFKKKGQRNADLEALALQNVGRA